MEQIELLYNKGVFAINEQDSAPEQRTIIVLGAARGGTSMVAGALHHLGVPMGEGLSAVYEDVALSSAIEENREGDVDALIAARNAMHPVWGWKRPSAISHRSAWEGKFLNPRFVVVFRDPFAIANRNRISMLSDVVANMRAALGHLESMIGFLEVTSEPILLVSYEKAMADPEHFVEQLRKFVGLSEDVPIDAAVRFIQPNPEAYLRGSRITNAKGVLDRAEGRRIAGWAMLVQAPNLVAKIRICINDEREYVLPANIYRKDVQEKGLHPTGRCGFLLELPADQPLVAGDVVSARVEGDIRDLVRSPLVIPQALP